MPRDAVPAVGAAVARAVGVCVVVAVLALVGYTTFRVTSRAASSPDVRAAAPSATAGAIPKATGRAGASSPVPQRSTKGPAKKPARVAANGQQLWAPSPFPRIKQDQGSSIALPDGRTLWIFADTFQHHDRAKPDEPGFFNTSAAGLTDAGSWRLEYAADQEGVPVEFLPRTEAEFDDHRSDEWYEAVWPTGNTQLPDGRIIIAYAKYRVMLRSKTFDFLGSGLYQYSYPGRAGFLRGAQATRIADDIWSRADGAVRSPIYADGWVFFQQCENLQCFSLRVRPGSLADRSAYQWWTGGGWSTDRLARDRLTFVTNHPGGNASVVRLRDGVYAMADTEVGAVSPVGHLWVAPNPWGPWSASASFYFPHCPGSGCYGLNLHPSQSTSKALRVSYATSVKGPLVRVYDVPVSISPDGSAIRVR